MATFADGQVDLVDGHDDRHAGVPGVADRLDGLGHDLVVGRHHEDDDVGDLGTAGTHGGKGLVTRRVEEGDGAAIGQIDVIRADVLGDAAGLTGHDVGLADVVEQRGLAVVDVAHDGDDGRTRHAILDLVLFLDDAGLGSVCVFLHGQEAELGCNELDLVEVEALVHRHHEAQFLEGELDDLGGGDLHESRELAHRDELVDANDGLLALLLLGHFAGAELLIARAIGAADLLAGAALQALEGLLDVRLHRVTIDLGATTLLPLLAGASTSATLTRIGGARRCRRRTTAATATRRGTLGGEAAAEDGLRATRAIAGGARRAAIIGLL